jgi:hypothetical protein
MALIFVVVPGAMAWMCSMHGAVDVYRLSERHRSMCLEPPLRASRAASRASTLMHDAALARDKSDDGLRSYPSEPQYHTINKHFPGLKVLHREPWIFEVPHFLTKPEARQLLDLCRERMQPSLDSQGQSRDGWEFDNLRFDPSRIAGWLEKRLTLLTGLTYECVSDGTAMRYWPGSTGLPAHVDHTYQTFYRGSGRVLTCFIYLSDHETSGLKGGGTRFPGLDLILQPGFGKLVCFFPGTLDGDADRRLIH